MYHGPFLIILFETEMTVTKSSSIDTTLRNVGMNILAENVEGGVISWKETPLFLGLVHKKDCPKKSKNQISKANIWNNVQI